MFSQTAPYVFIAALWASAIYLAIMPMSKSSLADSPTSVENIQTDNDSANNAIDA